MRPLYDYGDEVRLLRNVRNDGTFPGEPTGALLIRRGSTGFVRDVGTFLQDQLIYSVHFLDCDRVVGCREHELQLASAPWIPSRFETREKVCARLPLGRGGRVLVEQGTLGEVVKVLRGSPERPPAGELAYQIQFPGFNLLQVPESALDEPPQPASGSHSVSASATAKQPASTQAFDQAEADHGGPAAARATQSPSAVQPSQQPPLASGSTQRLGGQSPSSGEHVRRGGPCA